MARVQVVMNVTKSRGNTNSLGTSSSGDVVIEVDNAKVKTITQLGMALQAALNEFRGMSEFTP